MPRPSVPDGFTSVGNDLTTRVRQAGAVITRNEFGLDTTTITFKYRRDKLKDVIPRPGEPDEFYRHLTFTGKFRAVESTTTFIDSIECEYAGRVQGTHSNGTFEFGRRRETVQLVTDEEENLEIVYHAPWTVYRYVVEKEPREPRFNGPQILGPNNQLTISTTRPARYTGLLAEKTEYLVRNQLEEWKGKWRGRHLEVEEEWVRRIVPRNGLQDKPSIRTKAFTVAATPIAPGF